MYTEIQKKGKKTYYYLSHTIRVDSAFKKIRVFLGVNLSESKLKTEINHKKKILDAKISVIKEANVDDFALTFDFSKKILSKLELSKLERIKNKFSKKLKIIDKDVLNLIRESFIIRYTFDTNAAEGNTISLKETELILKKEIVPKSHSLREVHEIENTKLAYSFIEDYNGDLNHKFILKVHELVTKKTLSNEKNEGRYRIKDQNVIMTGSKHYPPKGGKQIKKLISKLIESYNSSKLSKIESAIIFHSAFILIHPFIDGNGRVSRLIFNWMLIKEGYPPVNFPSIEHIEYTDLMELSREGDSKPLAKHVFEKIINNSMSTELLK